MAQVDAQRLLDVAEKGGKFATWDIEALGLNGDYNSVLAVSIKPFGKHPLSFVVRQPGDDSKVVKDAAEALAEYDVWLTYYGKGFDVPMLRARLLRHDLPDLAQRHHVDLFFVLKSAVKTSRKSQGHLLSWLRLPEEKMSVSADDWSTAPAKWPEVRATMVKRCESDTRGLEALYKRTKHLIRDVRK